MAGRDRIEIDFTANVAELADGTSEIADALDDTSQALEDVGDAGAQAGDDISDGLGEAGDAVDETSDKLDDVGEALGDVGSAAKDALEGDFAGAAEGALEAVAGIAEGIPGIGGLIGTAVSEIGIGLVGIFEQSAEQSKERISSMYADMAQSGQDYLSVTYQQQEAQRLIEESYPRIAEVAKLTGLTEAEVVRAMITAGEDRNNVLEIANQKYQEQLALTSTGTDYSDTASSAAAGLAAQYGKVVFEFGALNDEQSVAIGQTQLFRDVTTQAMEDARVGVEDLKTATDTFQPIPITADLSQAEAAVNEFVGRRRAIIVRVDTSQVVVDGG